MKTDREKLIEVLKNNPYGQYTYEQFADYLISKGVTIPVRCGECKHWCEPRIDICGQQEYGDCLRPLGAYEDGIETNADDFCAYGERKEE